jgi:hypothetical protein
MRAQIIDCDFLTVQVYRTLVEVYQTLTIPFNCASPRYLTTRLSRAYRQCSVTEQLYTPVATGHNYRR